METLLKSGYLCNPQQAYALRKVTVAEGRARGAVVIEVCTAGGLQVDILPDAGLDIGQVRYKGINMSFISKNGFDNPAIGVSMTMTWSENLPILVQWRSMASGDYALGLEPTNCYIMGRHAERENGTLPVLKPFESVTTSVNFSFRSV